MAARFITLEGGEGAGKSTQAARLAAWLRERGHAVTTTREPGGSPRAEAIRGSLLSGEAKALGPFAEALLFATARRDHVARTIRPALEAGGIVVCDRFADSTRAYQGAAGRVHETLIDALEAWAVDGLVPDVTLVLDLPVDAALARASARRDGAAADRYEGEGRAFHERLRRAFLDIAAREPERCALIDADGEPDAVFARIRAALAPRLPPAPTARPELADAGR